MYPFGAPFISIIISKVFSSSVLAFSTLISIVFPSSDKVLVIPSFEIVLNIAYSSPTFNEAFTITGLLVISSSFVKEYLITYPISSYPLLTVLLSSVASKISAFNFDVIFSRYAVDIFTFPLFKSIFDILLIPKIPTAINKIIINVAYFLFLYFFILSAPIFLYKL